MPRSPHTTRMVAGAQRGWLPVRNGDGCRCVVHCYLGGIAHGIHGPRCDRRSAVACVLLVGLAWLVVHSRGVTRACVS